MKVEGTATSDAVCENATDVPSSREITSYPPIDEIVTNNVTHPTEGNYGNRFPDCLCFNALISILYHVYACFYVQNCAFSTSNPKEYIYYIITLYKSL